MHAEAGGVQDSSACEKSESPDPAVHSAGDAPGGPSPAPSEHPARVTGMIESLAALGRALARWSAPLRTQIARRRDLRTIFAGATLVVGAWIGAGGPGWELPLTVAGLALIAIGVIGSRFSGSLTIEWSPEGVQVQMSSSVQARSLAAAGPTPPALPDAPETAIPPSEIEGRAETIEIHAAELRAAVAADPGRSAQPGGDEPAEARATTSG